MASRKSPASSEWFTVRTSLVTAVSIIGVGLAGATAVGANMGILNSSNDGAVEDTSVPGNLDTTSAQVVGAYLSGAGQVQRFAVDAAGVVSLIATDSEMRLDEVVPTAGWTWTLLQSSQTSLQVIFTDGTRNLVFSAKSAPGGSISTYVSEPVNRAPAVSGDDGESESLNGDG